MPQPNLNVGPVSGVAGLNVGPVSGVAGLASAQPSLTVGRVVGLGLDG
ncbi:hypothetical protein AKJ09_10007 [Labilithrix luteola]|uniref:Uncharacterized protein n=1 Tax=Labilithrix luteola TaxID=1391654 RepID=A0A0K1QC70_9BACT|nr:hypothetical protein [Labilithrix luteola]AKV03344.1 hypothetical protein AKJ09_10007 [Labilithrix luteola]